MGDVWLSEVSGPDSTSAFSIAQAVFAPGARLERSSAKLHRLEENAGAVDVKLNPDDISQIDKTFSQISVQDDRYPAHRQKRVGG